MRLDLFGSRVMCEPCSSPFSTPRPGDPPKSPGIPRAPGGAAAAARHVGAGHGGFPADQSGEIGQGGETQRQAQERG